MADGHESLNECRKCGLVCQLSFRCCPRCGSQLYSSLELPDPGPDSFVPLLNSLYNLLAVTAVEGRYRMAPGYRVSDRTGGDTGRGVDAPGGAATDGSAAVAEGDRAAVGHRAHRGGVGHLLRCLRWVRRRSE